MNSRCVIATHDMEVYTKTSIKRNKACARVHVWRFGLIHGDFARCRLVGQVNGVKGEIIHQTSQR